MHAFFLDESGSAELTLGMEEQASLPPKELPLKKLPPKEVPLTGIYYCDAIFMMLDVTELTSFFSDAISCQ